jgi:hypothetical protein
MKMNYPAASYGVSELSSQPSHPRSLSPRRRVAGVQKKCPGLDSRLRGNDKAVASCGELDPCRLNFIIRNSLFDIRYSFTLSTLVM